MSGVKLFLGPILLFLLFQSISGEEICGVDGYNLGTLEVGDYWTMRFKAIKDCMLPLETTNEDIESCDLLISVCKPLGSLCPGYENSTTCQEVILKNQTRHHYFDMGVLNETTTFKGLDNITGFAANRFGENPVLTEDCNGTIMTILLFICDPFADWDEISDHNATKYLYEASQPYGIGCTYYVQLNYSGACYVAPTLSPSHCNIEKYNTTALSNQEYWWATVSPSVCYLEDTASCVFYLAFCHPIPAVLGGAVCYDSAVCQDSISNNGTKSKMSMGTYGRYTAFKQNDETDGFHLTVDNGTRPDDQRCPNGLKTQIILKCNKTTIWTSSNVTEYLLVAYRHVNDPCMYTMEFQCDSACKITTTSKSQSQSPVGWVLMGILSASVIAYLVVGSAYMYFVKHEAGMKILPNFLFWTNFVTLVLEGCMFFLGAITCFQLKKGKLPLISRKQPDYDKI